MQFANRVGVAASEPETGVQAMPQSRSTSRTALTRLVLLAFFGWALYLFSRKASKDVHVEADALAKHEGEAEARGRGRSRRQRFATSLAFATLFFAGAALSAGAGDMLVGAVEGDPTTGETTTEEAPPDAAPSEEAIPPAEDPAEAPIEEPAAEPTPEEGTPAEGAPGEGAPGEPAPEPGTEAPADEPAPDGGEPTAPSDPAAPADPSAPAEGTPEAPATGGEAGGNPSSASPETTPPLLAPHEHEDEEETRAIDPEAGAFGENATVWLHRNLGDPTPPAKRLAPAFARRLSAEAKRARVDWALLLGALRADGFGGRFPAGTPKLRALGRQLAARQSAGEWQALLSLRGRTAYADRALALTRYNRAVGLNALVMGLDASKRALEQRVLGDGRLSIYGSGRMDIAAHRIDVRVLVLLRYLAEAHGQVTVSSLQSGHRLYSRPGVVSAHIYGLAVDIATLGGSSIMGNSQPGGVTEMGVRNVLLLPAELRPQQVISLLGMGGPSFPMANHADHIHVGY